MPRPPRVFSPAISAHLIQRGHNRCRIFDAHIDYVVFLELLRRQATRHMVDIHGFVLMTNHFHLLATPTDGTGIPYMMKAITCAYVRYYNRQYQRMGTLWNGRYRSIPIDDERYWLTCLRYIEQNPVRAGMVDAPGEYQWSSYRKNATGLGCSWLAPHPLMVALGSTQVERQRAYAAMCHTPLESEEVGHAAASVKFAVGPDLTQAGVRLESDPNC